MSRRARIRMLVRRTAGADQAALRRNLAALRAYAEDLLGGPLEDLRGPPPAPPPPVSRSKTDISGHHPH